ncbi:TSC22 domain family protein 1-like isoform X2 [Artemia franciscana]|uniref:Uncharacterized protein n=1 Tax=Artemia franciscana TaxID=6661 RepID=A0AA88HWR0_ARTSF|nr:hypothetical protein QYM36_005129 [Artemia franciscana]
MNGNPAKGTERQDDKSSNPPTAPPPLPPSPVSGGPHRKKSSSFQITKVQYPRRGSIDLGDDSNDESHTEDTSDITDNGDPVVDTAVNVATSVESIASRFTVVRASPSASSQPYRRGRWTIEDSYQNICSVDTAAAGVRSSHDVGVRPSTSEVESVPMVKAENEPDVDLRRSISSQESILDIPVASHTDDDNSILQPKKVITSGDIGNASTICQNSVSVNEMGCKSNYSGAGVSSYGLTEDDHISGLCQTSANHQMLSSQEDILSLSNASGERASDLNECQPASQNTEYLLSHHPNPLNAQSSPLLNEKEIREILDMKGNEAVNRNRNMTPLCQPVVNTPCVTNEAPKLIQGNLLQNKVGISHPASYASILSQNANIHDSSTSCMQISGDIPIASFDQHPKSPIKVNAVNSEYVLQDSSISSNQRCYSNDPLNNQASYSSNPENSKSYNLKEENFGARFNEGVQESNYHHMNPQTIQQSTPQQFAQQSSQSRSSVNYNLELMNETKLKNASQLGASENFQLMTTQQVQQTKKNGATQCDFGVVSSLPATHSQFEEKFVSDPGNESYNQLSPMIQSNQPLNLHPAVNANFQGTQALGSTVSFTSGTTQAVNPRPLKLPPSVQNEHKTGSPSVQNLATINPDVSGYGSNVINSIQNVQQPRFQSPAESCNQNILQQHPNVNLINPNSNQPGSMLSQQLERENVRPMIHAALQIQDHDVGSSATGGSSAAIDNRIVQALDIVKDRLIHAVREEVDELKLKIEELNSRIRELESENSILRGAVPSEFLAQLDIQKNSGITKN